MSRDDRNETRTDGQAYRVRQNTRGHRLTQFLTILLFLTSCRSTPATDATQQSSVPDHVPSHIATLQAMLVAGPSDTVAARFTTDDGRSVDMPLGSANPPTFVAPLYIDPQTGELADATFSVALVLASGETTAVGSVAVAAPPQLSIAPGALTSAFLKGLLREHNNVPGQLATLIGQPKMNPSMLPFAQQLQSEHAALAALATAVDDLRSGKVTSMDVLSIQGPGGAGVATLTMASVRTTDRILAAFLREQGRARLSGVAALAGELQDGDLVAESDTWFHDMTHSLSKSILESGKSMGSTLAAVTAGLGLAAMVAGSTVAGPLLATTGGLAYLATTFAPAYTAMVIATAGEHHGATDQPHESSFETIAPALRYLADRTLANSMKFFAGNTIKETAGPLGAAVYNIVAVATGWPGSAAAKVTAVFFRAGDSGCGDGVPPLEISFTPDEVVCPEAPASGADATGDAQSVEVSAKTTCNEVYQCITTNCTIPGNDANPVDICNTSATLGGPGCDSCWKDYALTYQDPLGLLCNCRNTHCGGLTSQCMGQSGDAFAKCWSALAQACAEQWCGAETKACTDN